MALINWKTWPVKQKLASGMQCMQQTS